MACRCCASIAAMVTWPALVSAGLSGIEALITHVATGQGFASSFARTSRGWSQEEWDDTVSGLAARGLLEGDGVLSPAGQVQREHIEEQTDQTAAPPWQHLGDERTEEVIRIGKAMTRAVLSAGALPRDGVFAAR
jgi:hypothetical protein